MLFLLFLLVVVYAEKVYIVTPYDTFLSFDGSEFKMEGHPGHPRLHFGYWYMRELNDMLAISRDTWYTNQGFIPYPMVKRATVIEYKSHYYVNMYEHWFQRIVDYDVVSPHALDDLHMGSREVINFNKTLFEVVNGNFTGFRTTASSMPSYSLELTEFIHEYYKLTRDVYRFITLYDCDDASSRHTKQFKFAILSNKLYLIVRNEITETYYALFYNFTDSKWHHVSEDSP